MWNLKSWESVTYDVGESPITFEVKRLNYPPGKVFSKRLRMVRKDRVTKYALIAGSEQGERQRKLIARTNALITAAGHAAVEVGDDLDAAFTAAEAHATALGIPIPPMTPEELTDLLKQDEGRIKEQYQALDEFDDSIDDDWWMQVCEHYVRNVQGLTRDGGPVTTGLDLYDFADQALTLFVLTTIEGFITLPQSVKKASSSPPTSALGGASVEAGVSVAAPVESEDGTSGATAPEIPSAPPSSSDPVAV